MFPAHIEWILAREEARLKNALASEGVQWDRERIIQTFMNADPSIKKGAFDWLIKNYILARDSHSGESIGFRWEDIEAGEESKVFQTLLHFAQHRKKLEGDARNLAHYKSVSAVYSAISEWLPREEAELPSKRAQKREEKDQILEESIIVHRDEHGILAVPLSKRAAQWWGRGTQWCTSATTSSNYFNSYNREAPLIVAVFPHGLEEGGEVRKFQIWTTDANIQFMDENDAAVEPDLVRKHWKFFQPLLEWALEQNPAAIKWFPEYLIAEKPIERWLEMGDIGLSDVPEKLRTQQMCLKTVKVRANSFQWVPKDIMNAEIIDACSSSYHFIENIPHHLHTPLLAKRALHYSLYTVFSLNLDIIDHQMVLEALKKSKDYAEIEGFLKEILIRKPVLITSEVALLMVQKNSRIISKLPKEVCTSEIYQLAMERSAENLKHIPDEFLSDDMIKTALSLVPGEIRNLPIHRINRDIILQVLDRESSQWLKFEWLPDEYRTREIFLKILARNESQLEIVPPELKDQDFYKEAIALNPGIILWIDEELVEEEWWEGAVMADPDILSEAPASLHREDFYLNLLESKPFKNPWRWFEEDAITSTVAEKMVETSGAALEKVKLEFQTLEMCVSAVSTHPEQIDNVSDEFREQVRYRLCLPAEFPKKIVSTDVFSTVLLPNIRVNLFERKEEDTSPQWTKEILQGLKERIGGEAQNRTTPTAGI